MTLSMMSAAGWSAASVINHLLQSGRDGQAWRGVAWGGVGAGPAR